MGGLAKVEGQTGYGAGARRGSTLCTLAAAAAVPHDAPAMPLLWFRRFLSLCPPAITVLWVAGVTRFRGYSLTAQEWLVAVLGVLAMHVLLQRARRQRPLPPLPERANPLTLAALAAALVAAVSLLLLGVLELVGDTYVPSDTSWFLRTTWHGACVFGVCYCGFLHGLLDPRRTTTRPGGHGGTGA